jgi:hypothetical protein
MGDWKWNVLNDVEFNEIKGDREKRNGEEKSGKRDTDYGLKRNRSKFEDATCE